MEPAGSNPPVVTGRGSFVPADVLTNEDVAAVVDPARLAAFVRANAPWRQLVACCNARAARTHRSSFAGRSPAPSWLRVMPPSVVSVKSSVSCQSISMKADCSRW